MLVRTFFRVAVAAACAIFHAGAANAGAGFSFEMPDERLRIVIPDIPQMTMRDHPNAAVQPSARYLGGDVTGYTISVLTPASDRGYGSEACAVYLFSKLLLRYGLDPKKVTRRKTDANTHVALFPVRMGPFVQFKTYLLSGYGGTHCIEVHVSRMVPADDKDKLIEQLTDWYKGFHDARIEAM